MHIRVPNREAAARSYVGPARDLAGSLGNQYELNCYEYERVEKELIEADGFEPVRDLAP